MRIRDWSSDVCSSDLQGQFRLEIDMVRQLEMLHETRSLDVIGMVEDEFGILRRRGDILAEILGAQCAVDQRHRHRLALGIRSEERRVGQECVSKGRSRWAPDHEKKKTN